MILYLRVRADAREAFGTIALRWFGVPVVEDVDVLAVGIVVVSIEVIVEICQM